MPLFAGADCSGTPDLAHIAQGQPLYVGCLAAIEVATAEHLQGLQAELDSVRDQFELERDREYHGHEMREEVMTAVLEVARATGVRFGCLIVDKQKSTALYGQNHPLPSATGVYVGVISAVITMFCRPPSQPLHSLLCDADIQGKERQQGAATAIRHCHRSLHPNARLKVGFRASETSALIQLADVVAYAIMSEARGRIKDSRLLRVVRTIRQDPLNKIEGPSAWSNLRMG